MPRYVWVKDEPVGMESAELTIDANGLTARATAFGSAPVPYRLDLELDVGADWTTRRLELMAAGDGWMRSLLLTRSDDGTWREGRSADGIEPPSVGAGEPDDAVGAEAVPSGVLDVDVQYSPVTNLMPVRRLGGDTIEQAGPAGSFTMAWVSVPSLAVTLDDQRYTLLGTDDGDVCARFDSGDGFFTAVLRLDGDGVVVEYPGIARRLR